MADALEPTDPRFATWVTPMIIVSVVMGLMTILLSLSDGMVGKALPFGIGSLVFAVSALIMAQIIKEHRAAATVALVVGIVALGSGLQSALLGTGQIN